MTVHQLLHDTKSMWTIANDYTHELTGLYVYRISKPQTILPYGTNNHSNFLNHALPQCNLDIFTKFKNSHDENKWWPILTLNCVRTILYTFLYISCDDEWKKEKLYRFQS